MRIYFSLIAFIFSFTTEAKKNRSYHAIKQFKIENPFPANGKYNGRCDGYVINHVVPLACGGLDSPKNMQWQTLQASKLKDKWEIIGC